MMAVTERAEDEVVLRTPRLTLAPLSRTRRAALRASERLGRRAHALGSALAAPPTRTYVDFIASDAERFDRRLRHTWATSGPIGVAASKEARHRRAAAKMPRLGYWIGRDIGGTVLAPRRSERWSIARSACIRPNASAPACSMTMLRRAASSRSSASRRWATSSTHSRSRGGEVETVDMQITRADGQGPRQPRMGSAARGMKFLDQAKVYHPLRRRRRGRSLLPPRKVHRVRRTGRRRRRARRQCLGGGGRRPEHADRLPLPAAFQGEDRRPRHGPATAHGANAPTSCSASPSAPKSSRRTTRR